MRAHDILQVERENVAGCMKHINAKVDRDILDLWVERDVELTHRMGRKVGEELREEEHAHSDEADK